MIKSFLQESQMVYADKYKLKPTWLQYSIAEEDATALCKEVLEDILGFDVSIHLHVDEENLMAAVYLNVDELTEEQAEKVYELHIPWDEEYYMGEWIMTKVFPGADAAYMEYIHFESEEMLISIRIPEEAIE